jgi:hypothetical protein
MKILRTGLVLMMAAGLSVAGFGSAAQAQIDATESAPKSTAQPTQEVETALPTGPVSGGVVSAPSSTSQKNKEAEKLAGLIQSIKICTDTKERILRLRCYDELSTELGLMPEEVKTVDRARMGTYGFWEILSEKDPLGLETIYVSIAPYNRLSNPVYSAKTPVLNIRCRQGNTDIYLDWKSPLNTGRPLMKDIFIYAKADSDPEYRHVWSLSLDALAAFSPDPIEFIKSLRGKRKLIIKVTPAGGTLENLVFEIGQLDAALDIMIKRCYADGSDQQAPMQVRKPR